MLRTVLALMLAMGTAGVAGTASSTSYAAVAAAPVHRVAVTGTGVGMYPEFSPGTSRYAVTTTSETGGEVTVEATTSDRAGRIRVNGHLLTGDSTTLTGLSAGDEISVIIEDSAGTATHSLVYLPAGFPTLRAATRKPGIAPGLVGLTLTQWNRPAPTFEAMVDANGVPAYVRTADRGTMDLKKVSDARYTVFRPTKTPGKTGDALVELDSRFQEVARHETAGLVNTDGHDGLVLGNGHQILMASEPNAETGLVDAVVQEVDHDGKVVFQWSSAGIADESVQPGASDYAHINSVWLMKDGDLLVSLRHFSTVLKIARSDHDGFRRGDIVWRLGGRHSDFSFTDDDYPGGPCAQHTASELPNGHILIFDNGSGGISPNMCIDPANPTGPTVARTFTRVTEYDLGTVDADPSTPETARLVWQWLPGRYGFFAGSAQRLPNGNTMVGWAGLRDAIATEVNPAGETVWELADAVDPTLPAYSTYRAAKFPVYDAIAPRVSMTTPRSDVMYRVGERVVLDIGCTDRGGSGLRYCGGTGVSGDLVDTSIAGRHKLVLRAEDAYGNVTQRRRFYDVGPAIYRPDATIRVPGGRAVGSDVYGSPADQHVVRTIRRSGGRAVALVRLQNDGNAIERLQVRGTAGSRKFKVAYFTGTRNITKAVSSGSFFTPRLRPGWSIEMAVRVTRTRLARPGDRRVFRVRAGSTHRLITADRVAARVRATR